ncbi:hypothetical protein Nepgr_008739 [Nepenthes gracilis]|uniref:Uncharacterized protein n=1 Tax=Nepenthes gracilis TaxID=150966 RepID=A0AAD3XJK2_NEPGR|nr:hypothetical protein Nepgr_008739 [Nepenthes gracilis]
MKTHQRTALVDKDRAKVTNEKIGQCGQKRKPRSAMGKDSIAEEKPKESGTTPNSVELEKVSFRLAEADTKIPFEGKLSKGR